MMQIQGDLLSEWWFPIIVGVSEGLYEDVRER
jgi:hypothetical protein